MFRLLQGLARVLAWVSDSVKRLTTIQLSRNLELEKHSIPFQEPSFAFVTAVISGSEHNMKSAAPCPISCLQLSIPAGYTWKLLADMVDPGNPFKLGRDPPSLLFKQLVSNGFAIIENPVSSVTLEAFDMLKDWFQLPLGYRQGAATAAAHTAAAGRGFFSLPDKEVLEVKQQWSTAVQQDVRLVVHEVREPSAQCSPADYNNLLLVSKLCYASCIV
jgi:hypothetical protein